MKNAFKESLITNLATYRITQFLKSNNATAQEVQGALANALDPVKKNPARAHALPEAIIVSILEAYLTLLPKLLIKYGGEQHYDRVNKEIIDGIEETRSLAAAGRKIIPYDIDQYISYRLNLEVASANGPALKDIGLSEDMILKLTHTAKKHIYDELMSASSPSGAPNQGASACFVATACYGDANHETVLKYRKFRDEKLKRTDLGRMFIIYYYRYGRYLARFISKNEKVRKFCRYVLDKGSRLI